MNWLEFLLNNIPTLVGLIGGGVGILYWKENRDLKKKEVEKAGQEAAQSNVSTQSQKIDLGEKFITEMVAMQKMLQTNTTDTSAIVKSVSALNEKVDGIESRIDGIEKKVVTTNRTMAGYNNRLGTIERYMNGGLKEFAAHEKAEKRKK